jgi:hypothetical protein
MPVQLTRAFVEVAASGTVWDLGNQVLYDMCRRNPGHQEDRVILAKIWLIGRAYSAAIERRRKGDKVASDAFYEVEVAPRIRNSNIDAWFQEILNGKEGDLPLHLEAHARVMGLFSAISGLEKRSLASKYLHFHFPERFYIYDSLAQTAISRLTEPVGRIPPSLGLRRHDYAYARFFLRSYSLRGQLESLIDRPLTPRELDNVLLCYRHREEANLSIEVAPPLPRQLLP